MNLTNHLWRRIVLAALTGTVIVGAAGTAHADIAPRVTPLTVPAAPVTDGRLVAAVTAATAPRSVTAKAGNTTVKLAWRAPSSSGGAAVNKYRVQRARAGGAWKNIAYPTTRSYTAKGLTNGARYRFRVAAHNAAGWGPFSTAVKAVPRTVPSAPRSPVATPGNGTVKLAWLRPSSTGGATISKYRVQRATSAVGPWKNIAYPTTRGYTAGGLTNGTRYHFRIAASNTAGWSKPSTVVNTVPHTVPTAPLSPVATPGLNVVGLTWAEPLSDGGAPIEYYGVQRADSAYGPWTTIDTTAALKYTNHGLTKGTRYHFRIVAHNAAAAGWGMPSTVVDAVPMVAPSAPLTCNAQQALFGTQMKITWYPPLSDGGTPISGYTVEIRQGLVQLGVFYLSEVYSYDAQVPPGDYQVSVRAQNNAGSGGWCTDDVTIY